MQSAILGYALLSSLTATALVALREMLVVSCVL